MPNEILKTDANARTVSELLLNKKYQIDYYQREYRWQPKHVDELLNDLTEKFLHYYDSSHERLQGSRYGHYYLGSIILSKKNGNFFIVDGQQRLTTLTLLLIYLNNYQKNLTPSLEEIFENYIFSTLRGNKSFNLDVPDRKEVMEALYTNQPFDIINSSESIQNLIARYHDIENGFPDELKTPHALLMFMDWVRYNIDMVEIIAYSDEDAYSIFETMNDRGLSLNPTEMLKGFLLSNISSEEYKAKANEIWKKRVLSLVDMGREIDEKTEDVEAVKNWLRAKHAQTIRERKRGSENQDFELIHNAFHRWVKDNDQSLGLLHSEDYFQFIQKNFDKYTYYYNQMRLRAFKYETASPFLYFNNHNNFTLQYLLALSSIQLDDSEEIAWKKIQTVTKYIDMFVVRRMINFRTLSYSSIIYTIFNLTKKIRDLDLESLTQALIDEINNSSESFNGMAQWYLHGANKHHIQYILARITHFIEAECGANSSFPEYINKSKQRKAKRFEVEHIWADRFDYHSQEFAFQEEFRSFRNHFGGLILLPEGFNQSYGDLPYEEKLTHYIKENYLAKSLNEKWYEHNPEFMRFNANYSLNFHPHIHFSKSDMEERQALYQRLALIIWDPERLRVP